jgi:NAD-dependent SIR2 family protein deacetylase
MKTVFILGAGASVESGAPTMADFLQRAKQLHRNNAYGAAGPQIQDVIDAAYKDLKPVQVKSTIDYENIEELFSAIDIGQLIQCFGSRPKIKIDELRKSIVVFIYRTIEETVRFPVKNQRIGLPKGYDKLVELVHQKVVQPARPGLNEVSFITFNYDTCLEFALVRNNLGVDYGFNEPFLNEDENNYRVKVPVLKLHGSINWGICSRCTAIVPTEVNPYRRMSWINYLDCKDLPLTLGTNIAGKHHSCGTALDPLPLIVPPTWNKSSSTAPGLQEVWKRAAKELGSADNIVVIGYSLPLTDMFFKYLFALGIDSDTHLEKFIVINGPDGGNTESRFKGLLGPMTQGSFQFYPFLFSSASAIRVIEEALSQ